MSARARWPKVRARRPSFALGDSAAAGGDASRPLAGAGRTSPDLVDLSTAVHAGEGGTSMAALVPLGVARSRPQRHRGITLEEGQPFNTGVFSGSLVHQKGKKTCRKRKSRNTNTPPTEPIPVLSDEIVLDILVRLPVKSLLRCKSVCKSWRAIITDPFFVRAHLQRSASRCEQDPCLVITPFSIDCSVFTNHLPFYQWQQGATMATLMHDMDFDSIFRPALCLAHCDGLVLVATYIRLHLFNPATGETIALPDGDSSRQFSSLSRYPGLGLDPRTGKHKVVRSFNRSIDPDTGMAEGMGMEVFTVLGNSNGGCSAWREIKDDLPYPAQTCGAGVAVNGFLFWRLASNHHDQGLLRLSLADESFGITRLPDPVGPALPFRLHALHRELCVSAWICEDTVTMWMLPIQDDGGQGQTWEPHYTVHLTSMYHPLAFLPGGRMMLHADTDNKICLYDMATTKLTTLCQLDRMKFQGRRARTWKNTHAFAVHLYTESLVRISA